MTPVRMTWRDAEIACSENAIEAAKLEGAARARFARLAPGDRRLGDLRCEIIRHQSEVSHWQATKRWYADAIRKNPALADSQLPIPTGYRHLAPAITAGLPPGMMPDRVPGSDDDAELPF